VRPIRLLHISDLHEWGLRETDRWCVNAVLGSSWHDNLDVIAGDGRPIDFIRGLLASDLDADDS
jgi:hypothetical protein